MKLSGFLLALTLLNLALLTITLSHGQKAEARDGDGILRGKGLQITDDAGRVRASITVFPADPKWKTADGKPYPETVLLRLINEKGAPNVKLGADTNGAALGLGGETNPTYIQMIARGDRTYLNMIDRDGKRQAIKPGKGGGLEQYIRSP
jgi:hypothetical protein